MSSSALLKSTYNLSNDKPSLNYRDYYRELNNKLAQNMHSLATALLGVPQHQSMGS